MPAHYDKIKNRWTLIARLYHEAGSAIMATDRAAGTSSLKAELEMLEDDIKEYRALVATIEIRDIVDLYVLAGRRQCRAEQIVKEDLGDLKSSLERIEMKIKEVKADIVYGFEDKV
tara:strand:- start:32681 stop:33028 length:348 start_codon:yes stop_codon:yes gene_type:complete